MGIRPTARSPACDVVSFVLVLPILRAGVAGLWPKNELSFPVLLPLRGDLSSLIFSLFFCIAMFRQATKFAPRSAEAFLLAQESGYDAVEFWLGEQLIDQWQDVVELARSFPFDYALHFPNRGEFSTSQLENVIQLYHALGCSAMVIHQPMFDTYGAQLESLDSTVRLGIENHFLDTDKKLFEWATRSRYLTLDIEHLWLFTKPDHSLKQVVQTVEYLLSEFGEKLVHIHLPGYLPGQKEHRPQYCSRNLVMKAFTLLAESGYEGMVVSETARRFHNLEELTMDRLLHQRWHTKHQQRMQKVQLQAAGD